MDHPNAVLRNVQPTRNRASTNSKHSNQKASNGTTATPSDNSNTNNGCFHFIRKGFDRVILSLVFFILGTIIKKGNIAFIVPHYGRVLFGDNKAPAVTVVVHRVRFFLRVLLQGDIGFGESYMKGEFDTNNLTLFIHYIIINLYPKGPSYPWFDNISRILNLGHKIMYRFLGTNNLKTAKKNIMDHYDLGNEFYASFLDKTMTYSSAIFKNDQESLETAQIRKYDRIIESLGISSGDQVLEIGTGWGGFACHAAQTRDCHVTSITLSPNQQKYAEEKVTKLHLKDKVKILEMDFRNLRNIYQDNYFDYVVSIEMLEAVGPSNYDEYFRTLNVLTKPESKIAIQVITRFEDQYNKHKTSPDFINQYIFPGGCLPSLGVISQNATRHSLVIRHAEDISDSYVRTLRLWRERFNQSTAESDPKFDDVFLRKWNMYFSICEAGFHASNIQDYQIVFEKMCVDPTKLL